ncbi:MAG: molybdopterin-dependent oxidoreductase [Ilumatobacteraceae bacterium]
MPTTSHWGAYGVRVLNDEIVEVVPHPADPDPSPLLGGVAGAARHRTRVLRPAIRRGWLEGGAGPSELRGRDEFVEVSWAEAIELVAAELNRVRAEHGNESIFGGSYGWASAGIFHHAQTQLQRLLNLLGGYTRSINSYSTGTSVVLLPHLVGSADEVMRQPTSWPTIVEHTDLVVAFGGIPAKNVFVTPGGMTEHRTRDYLDRAAARGVEFALVSPVHNDLPPQIPATWYAVVPGTDVAMMLALAHTLLVENLADREFLDRYTSGAEVFEAYVLGAGDGVPKDAEWASVRCQIPADEIRQLARRMAAVRTLVTVTWSLQRIPHGEQPVWAGLALAALLGQIGLPGGGFGHGYGSMGDVGSVGPSIGLPHFAKGGNKVRTFIPVARIADMLLSPGETFAYDGGTYTYPDVRLVYWAGGNPFHHHQDLDRLRRALGKADTVIVNEPYWTSMARHADIVLPTTIPMEREDLGGGRRDTHLIAMHRATTAPGESLDDHEIFRRIAEHMGVGDAFTEGRTTREWLAHLYEAWRNKLGDVVPPFEQFWAAGGIELPFAEEHRTMFERFRDDPDQFRLKTPSGRIELASDVIAGFGYDDCPGHPTWIEPAHRDDDSFPLHLIANQPSTRLHGQLDVGAVSLASKVQGREPILINPVDAAARSIAEGDVVRIFNGRGACLAGAVVSTSVRPGVTQLSTGAWYDPLQLLDGTTLCVHGNPNALTEDRPTSQLSQGCAGQQTRVQVERFVGPVPPIRAHDPPTLAQRNGTT